MALDTIETARQEIAKIYIAAFNRVPDSAGLNNWMNQYTAGLMTYDEIAADFANQAEYQAAYPAYMTDSEYITAIYNNVFGRDPDAGGLQNWINQIANPEVSGITRGSVMHTMLVAADATGNTDGLRLDNQAEFAVYAVLNDLDINSATNQLSTITSVATSVDTAIANTDAAVTGETFTLTANIDSGTAFVGTTGNDIFNAATAGHFSSLDSLDGGAGTDTLNLVHGASLGTAIGATVTGIEVVNLIAAVAITNGDVSGFTGVTTLNVTSSGNIAGVVASATTNINVANGLAGVAVDGGNNVTITNGTAGNISVGAIAAAAGNVTATNTFATGTVGVKGAGTLTATSKDGAMTFTNGTAVVADTVDGVALADRTAHLATQTAAVATNTAATTDADTSGLAKVAAAAVVTVQAQLATDIAAATNVAASQLTALSIQLATNTAYNADAITLAQKVAIDAAFATGLVTSTAAARTAAQAVLTPIQTASTAASTAAIAADVTNDAAALVAKNAADAVVTADVTKAGLVDGSTVTATTNTALASATVNDNYGATNTITDGSTYHNTLTTVTLNNAGNTAITGLAIATVNVSNAEAASTLVVDNDTASNALTLNLTSSDVDVDDNAAAATTTLNVVSTGTNVLDLGLSAVTALNISGAGDTTITYTAQLAAAAVINASAATGDVTLSTLAGQTYTGSAGVDTITSNNGVLQTATVSGGTGSEDVLVLGNVIDFATTGAAKFTNFEVLTVNNITADVSKFTGSSIAGVVLTGATTGVTALTAAQALNVYAITNTTATIGVTGATTVGQLDTVKITVDDRLAAVNTLTLTAPVLAGVETLNLVATDNVVITALTSATALTNINVTGAGTVSITSGVVAMNVNTVIDASAVDADTVLNFVGGTANGVSLKAGDGDNTLTGTTIADKGNTIVSGDGDSTITGGVANDIITAGNGSNTIHGAAGSNTITVGNGNNAIDVIASAAANTITAGNGINVITGGSAADAITVGTGGNLITGAAGADTITFGAHVAGVIDGIVMTANSETYSAATAATIVSGTTALTGIDEVTGLHAGDTIDLFLATFTGTAGTTIAAATGTTVSLVRGNFVTATDIWTTSATGTDTLLVYDIDGAGAGLIVEAIALIGVVATGTAAAGIVTLA